MGLVRAALQRRPRQRLREPPEPDRVDDQPLSRGRAPAPRAAADSPLAEPGRRRSSRTARLEGCRLHEALAELWEFVGAANKAVDAEQPWVLAKAAKAGDDGGGGAPSWRAGRPLEACRLIGLAVARSCPRSRRVCSRSSDTPTRTARRQWRPADLDELAWGARAGESGRVADPEPLFPRSTSRPRGRDRRRVSVAPDLRGLTGSTRPDGIYEASA